MLPLDYWKVKEAVYPGLAAMARDILCIASAGVDLERVFNYSKDVCHYKRNLSPDTVRAVMITEHPLRQQIEDQVLAVTDTINCEHFSIEELQREANDRIKQIEESLQNEYILDEEGILNQEWEVTPSQLLKRPTRAYQGLYTTPPRPLRPSLIQYRRNMQTEMDIYEVPSSPPERLPSSSIEPQINPTVDLTT